MPNAPLVLEEIFNEYEIAQGIEIKGDWKTRFGISFFDENRREPSLQEMIGANEKRRRVQSGSFPPVISLRGRLAEVFKAQQLHLFLKQVFSDIFTDVFSCFKNENIAFNSVNSVVDNYYSRQKLIKSSYVKIFLKATIKHTIPDPSKRSSGNVSLDTLAAGSIDSCDESFRVFG